VHGKSSLVALTPITVDVHQTLDVVAHLTPQRPLDFVLVFDDVTNLDRLVFCEILHPTIRIDTRLLADAPRRRLPDAVDVREAHPDAFVFWDINPCDTCHRSCSFPEGATLRRALLALALLVALVLADHSDNAFPPDDLAVRAYSLD
jgi:hypothetical protein